MVWGFLILSLLFTGVIIIGASLVFVTTLRRRKQPRGFPVEPTKAPRISSPK